MYLNGSYLRRRKEIIYLQIDGFAVFLGFVDNPRDTVLGTTSKIIFGQKNNLSQNDGDV